MLFKDITLIDENFEVKEHMYVGVKADKIAYIGPAMPAEDYGEVYDGNNKLLIPGFYNSHSHLAMTYMRGYGENLPLMTWLGERIFPFEAKLTPEDIYYGTLMGVAEMLRYGIVGTTDMYLNYDAQGRALADSYVKANYAQCVTWMDPTSYYDLPIYKDTLESIKKFNGYDNGRIKTTFSLHAEYTSTEKIAKAVAEAAAESGSTMHVHVSETQGEVDICRKRHQRRSPVRYLSDCGIFNVPTVAAHCVHIDDEDMDILKEHNVTVATCPKSNAKLASGICPVSDLLEKGVNVAIGTDSVASNNNLNMVEEMRFFNLLQKAIYRDSTIITPAQTLYAATRAGAIGQGREDCGMIKEGFKADLVVMDIDNPYMKPCYNALYNLIYSASGSDVVLTMVDGRVLYKDGEYPLMDIEKISYEFEQHRQRILADVTAEAETPDLIVK